ncbi:hypothetical protein WA026_009022 [Henosepilachna vigintioctopunctata]|uniref:Cytochrome P450 n=1 Tax=Henosepilachna vigintioctopunctata TaxID=420089 RepID=A0AAW1UNR0_9CUCU
MELVITLLTVCLVILISIWMRKKFSFWKMRGIETPPLSFYIKHMRMAFLQENSFADRDLLTYKYFKDRSLQHGGLYFLYHPVYVPMDLKIIKHILQVDHEHFMDRGFYVNEAGDPMSAHLFCLEGAKWKNLRKKLTPTFSSGKMKMVFETLLECTVDLKTVMDKHLDSSVNIKDITARFTTDVIGSCAFGLICSSLDNPNSEFRLKGQDIFHRGFLENIKQVILYSFPDTMRYLNVKMIHEDVSEFFTDVVRHTVEHREKNEVHKKDLMELLIKLKNSGNVDDDKSNLENTITMEEIAAQAFIFFVAGYETSSSTMAFCLYELCNNLDIQHNVREEIIEVLEKSNGKLTYESIAEMKYLEKVISETLRKYPPLSTLFRICTKDFKVPGTDLVLPKGLRLMVPAYGIHHDPEYYPEPSLFDPERFSDENKNTRPDFSYLPFGLGPRMCIGMRFGLLQTKVGLIKLLMNYKFTLNERTKLPLRFDPESLTIATNKDLWLNIRKV